VTAVEPDLSAVVLCYRAGESINDVLCPLHGLLETSGTSHELILVANYWEKDDDPTPAIVRRFASEHDRVNVVAEPKRGAMGWDMRAGLAAASGRHVVVIDGDAQNPVEDVLRIYSSLREGNYDVMKGRRKIRHDGLYRRTVSFGFNVLFRLLFGTWSLWDINGKPKALTRQALDAMGLHSDDWFIDAEIVLEARRLDLRIGELPVVFRENKERSSFVRVSAIWEFLANMLRRRLGKM
jgi:glycosyltransferase involved in cell wall biosynthesis